MDKLTWKQKTEEAINKYIGFERELGEDLSTTMCRNAFADGALWRVNSSWHLPEEKPIEGCDIIAQDSDGVSIYCPSKMDWKAMVSMYRITRWAYPEDLLP